MLMNANVVLYDALINRKLLEYVPKNAKRIFVGKRKGMHSFTQDEINELIVKNAFEYAKTEEAAFKSIARLQDNIGLEYPVLLAQYGTSDKAKAQEKLPMLNHVLSYPTTVYIDKIGRVRKIHTGFNGPATGDKFTQFKAEFSAFIDDLLNE